MFPADGLVLQPNQIIRKEWSKVLIITAMVGMMVMVDMMVMVMVIFAKCRSQVSERGSIATYNISLHRGGIFHDFRKAVRSSYFILKHIAVPCILVMCYRNQWVQTINAKTFTTIVELGN